MLLKFQCGNLGILIIFIQENILLLIYTVSSLTIVSTYVLNEWSGR